MKFLNLNGLKYLLGKIVKYDKGTYNVSNINVLSVDKINTTYVQNKDASGVASTSIIFPDTDTISFKANDVVMEINSRDGIALKAFPELKSLFPEEFDTLKHLGLFLTLANLLHELKGKGIIE